MDDFTPQCPLTQFSRTLFAKPVLSRVLLELQNQAEFNLNIVFYLLWIAKKCHGRLAKRQLKMLQAQIDAWHQQVILELKYTYSLLEKYNDPEAMEIKRAVQEEIVRANDIEQCLLFETEIKTNTIRRAPLQQLSDACASIANSCSLKQHSWVTRHHATLAILFSTVFDEVTEEDIERELTLLGERIQLPRPSATQQPMWE